MLFYSILFKIYSDIIYETVGYSELQNPQMQVDFYNLFYQ